MRRSFPLTALVLLAVALPAAAVERREIAPGDRLLVSITAVAPVQEFPIRLPRGAELRLRYRPLAKKALDPGVGLLERDYDAIRMIGVLRKSKGITRTTIWNEAPLATSDLHRLVVVGNEGSRGDARVDTTLKVPKRLTVKARADDEEPVTDLPFGAPPGYAVSYKLSWKGTGPVTVLRIEAPDDGELTTTQPVKTRKRTAKGGGYTTTALGDHRVVLDVPEGTTRWNLTLTVKGAKSFGVTHDLRVIGEPVPDGLELSAISTQLESGGPLLGLPSIGVVGELGGANELRIVAAGLTDGSGRPVSVLPTAVTISVDGDNDPPSFYDIAAGETHAARVDEMTRDPNGRIVAFFVDEVTGPGGTGSTVVSNVVYGADGAPTGWTEVRTFDASGASHRLVISDAVRFANGAYTYSVDHTPPSGPSRHYDFLPLQ